MGNWTCIFFSIFRFDPTAREPFAFHVYWKKLKGAHTRKKLCITWLYLCRPKLKYILLSRKTLQAKKILNEKNTTVIIFSNKTLLHVAIIFLILTNGYNWGQTLITHRVKFFRRLRNTIWGCLVSNEAKFIFKSTRKLLTVEKYFDC
jgi:hypothetical protein